MAPVAIASPRKRVWKFDSLRKVGGHPVRVEGVPQVIKSPNGRAVQFDGQKDVLFIEEHPLAGAATFTAELVFRPDGGAFEQRLLHLESDESPPAAPGRGSTRMLIEIRVVNESWYLDAFMIGTGYRATMMAPDKLFPIGRWYHAAMTYDGEFFRSFVNGEPQMEMATPFKAQTAGRASVGARMNQVTHFKGAIREARFTHEALPAKAFKRP
ncbi:MAG TPA: LamG-like jellyroll fold domain-containing protein [Steroidobacteraceae bacterium]|nr:LamG-like jellyroll fold domain-containing protein [Steroidobacteraceae bacterium]